MSFSTLNVEIDKCIHEIRGSISEGVKMVSDDIVALNAAFKNHMLMIHQYVQKSMGHGRFKDAYGKFTDGLHPSNKLLKKWEERNDKNHVKNEDERIRRCSVKTWAMGYVYCHCL